MNKFFFSIGVKLSKEIPDTSNVFLNSASAGITESDKFNFSPLQADLLFKAINKFKTSNSFGVDNISSYFVNPIVVGLFDSTILVGGAKKPPPLPNS